MIRQDVSYPFTIDAVSGQAAQTSYPTHVDQMIRQILLTDPGERVCLPTFGAGLRRLLFAPMNSALTATTKLIVTQSLNLWLGDQITVQDVTVVTADGQASGVSAGPALPDTAILIQIKYLLIETQTINQLEIPVL
jgi:phage baseplate assembly protein W